MEVKDLNGYLEIIRRNIDDSSLLGSPCVIYTVVPDLTKKNYLDITKRIQSEFAYYNCLCLASDIQFGMDMGTFIKKLGDLLVNLVIMVDINHHIKELLNKNNINAIVIN